MILDTCALIWLEAGSKKLSPVALKRINEAPAVYVSVISGFEVALKRAIGKLELSRPPQEWFEKVVKERGLTVVPLDLDVSIAAAELPNIHDDPCDRWIIAAAKLNDWTIVTADERFQKYGVEVIC